MLFFLLIISQSKRFRWESFKPKLNSKQIWAATTTTTTTRWWLSLTRRMCVCVYLLSRFGHVRYNRSRQNELHFQHYTYMLQHQSSYGFKCERCFFRSFCYCCFSSSILIWTITPNKWYFSSFQNCHKNRIESPSRPTSNELALHITRKWFVRTILVLLNLFRLL